MNNQKVEKESHMAGENTEFVVRCAAARGVKLDAGSFEVEYDTAAEYRQQPQTERSRVSQMFSKEEKPILDIECALSRNGKKEKKGRMALYQDRLLFWPYIENKKIDTNESSETKIFFNNIHDIIIYKKLVYGIYILALCVSMVSAISSVGLAIISAVGLAIIYVGVAIFYVGVAVYVHLLFRKQIMIKLRMGGDFIIIFSNYDDKIRIVDFLKKHGVSVR